MGRTLKSAGTRQMFLRKNALANYSKTIINTTVGEIEAKLVNHVETITKDLFVMFDYFNLDRKILEEIVTNFVNGKIT